MKPIAIKNAPHWLNHSHVLTKGRMTAGDEAEINNGMVSVEVVNNTPVVVTHGGLLNMLKVQRMVTQGVVAVMLTGEDGELEKYEVKLPQEAADLLPKDLEYICQQIDAKSKPLSLEEQKAFLASANGHSGEHSKPANLSPMSL